MAYYNHITCISDALEWYLPYTLTREIYHYTCLKHNNIMKWKDFYDKLHSAYSKPCFIKYQQDKHHEGFQIMKEWYYHGKYRHSDRTPVLIGYKLSGEVCGEKWMYLNGTTSGIDYRKNRQIKSIINIYPDRHGENILYNKDGTIKQRITIPASIYQTTDILNGKKQWELDHI